MTIAKTVKISGRVQGVNFRYYTLQEAQKLGVAGTVENLTDGSVLVVAEGEPEKVEALIEWCQHGPMMARVKTVEVEDSGVKGFEKFIILR